MIKIFLLDQILIELLLNIQTKQEEEYEKSEEVHSKIMADHLKMKSVLEANKTEINQLKNKKIQLIKFSNDIIIEKKKLSSKFCPFCEKAFVNMEKLELHLIRKHLHDIKT